MICFASLIFKPTFIQSVLSTTFSVLQATMKVTVDNTEFKLDNVKEGSSVAIDVAGETVAAAPAAAVRPIC